MLDVGLGLRLLTPRTLKEYMGWGGAEDLAPTRVRGRVLSLECAKEVLLRAKPEVRVLREDR
jgi:hypothetical protein